MDYLPSFAVILLLDADDGQGSPIAVQFAGKDRTRAYLMRRGFDHPQVVKRFQVAGCHAEEVFYGEADDGWDSLMSPDWRKGRVPGARIAMQHLPLLDAFFLAECDNVPVLPLSEVFKPLCDTYLRERLRLARIIIPTVDGKDCWPWLIDIGFRQPFVDLGDDGDLGEVLEKHADQVVRVPSDF